MKRILIDTLLVLLCTASGVMAQSLPELVNQALENNYQIRISKNEAAIATNNNTPGNAGQLPSVGLDGGYATSFNNTRQRFADGTVREGNNAKNTNVNGAVMVNWTLFDGFRVQAKKDQLDYLQKVGEANARYYIEQTVSDLAMAYYQLMYEQRVLANNRRSLAISAFRLEVEKKRKEVGAGRAMDYDQALVDYQADSIRVLSQETGVRSLETEINRVAGNALEAALVVTDTLFPVLPLTSKDSLQNQVESNNSELAQQKLQELIAETETRMAKADRYPKVDLFAGYQYNSTSSEVGFFQSNKNFGPTFGVSVHFNLYDGGRVNREVRNAALEHENSTLTRDDATRNVQAQVINLYNQAVSLQMRIGLASDNVKRMQNVYAAAGLQLKQGAISGYDFRLAQLSLLNSELTLAQLQFLLKSTEISLNRLAGKIVERYMR
ncbi:MAG: TolC family protein [Flavobacteriales bacterium]|nr:TolC family protein [Flavobacteriales bacterium]MCB9447807.1 TolC family protein [Flavobacteriales bacterium]